MYDSTINPYLCETMKLQIDDKSFELMIEYDQIKKRARLIGIQLNVSYEHEHPIFLGVLNGSFMFMGDLMKEVNIACDVEFVRLASYRGDQRQEEISELIGLEVDLKGRHVVIVEDVVDTGHTLAHTLDAIHAHQPASVAVCTLLYKPGAVLYRFDNIAYVGFEIPSEFVVGYGLDYKGLGRNMKDIYREVKIVEEADADDAPKSDDTV